MGVAAEVGSVIRDARLAAGWTQAELGRRCGYAASTISRMERGKQSSVRDIEVLHRISKALAISPQRFGLAGHRHAVVAPVDPPSGPRVVPIREGGGWVDRRSVLRASLGVPVVAVLPGGAPIEPATALAGGLASRLLQPESTGEVSGLMVCPGTEMLLDLG